MVQERRRKARLSDGMLPAALPADGGGASLGVGPLSLLQAAIKAVPAVKYALGVGGIGAVVAIVAGFRIDYRVAIYGTVIVLGLMFVLVVFAQQAAGRRGVPGGSSIFLFLAWLFALLTVATPAMLFTCTFFSWPKPISEVLGLDVPVAKVGEVDGAGPVYEPPMIAGRTIDACIRSPQFPEMTGLQCTRPAQKQVADAFCQAAGFRSASADFRIRDTGQFQASLKYVEEIGPNSRLSGRWSQDNTGGAIFDRIVCAR